MYKYEVIIFWSNEDKAFIAEVPELPGCMAHGNTPENALKNAEKGLIRIHRLKEKLESLSNNDMVNKLDE
jgi:predicted RNase H-like HicB family nuclease